jgi:hypothetical protein
MWHAISNFSKIDIRTSFHIIEPTTVGQPPSRLPVGCEISIELAHGARTKMTVLRVGMNEADIQLPDGAIWRMTPHTENDIPVSIESPDMHSQDWVIRSQLPNRSEMTGKVTVHGGDRISYESAGMYVQFNDETMAAEIRPVITTPMKCRRRGSGVGSTGIARSAQRGPEIVIER